MTQFNNSILGFVHELKYDFDGLYERIYNRKIYAGENWINLADESFAADLASFFEGNNAHTNVLYNLTNKLNQVIFSDISEFSLFSICGFLPFLECKGFEYSYTIKQGFSSSKHSTILASSFSQESFNCWIDDETKLDSATKEFLKDEVLRVHTESTRGFDNGIDYAYIDVISYLINFFEYYNKLVNHVKKESKKETHTKSKKK